MSSIWEKRKETWKLDVMYRAEHIGSHGDARFKLKENRLSFCKTRENTFKNLSLKVRAHLLALLRHCLCA